ncbi:NAD(P)H-binding protein [Catenulispora yoronensis]|uniref:NAD(P)H-binding protein n=2 Tax=Catenulispora yoronensis TaxID=450799 RepID=A0ABN2V8E7_9ACTN
MTVLVIGATGKTGRAVVEALVARGAKVAAGSRTPGTEAADAAVRPVRFDWADRASWAPALDGVDGLYIVGPTGEPVGEVLVGELLADPVAAGLRRVVLLSVLGADRLPPEVMMADWERDVRASGKDWTILRPNWFHQNFGGGFAAGIREQGVLELPAADAALSFVDTRDVAEVAAVALTEDGHAGQVYDITGPQSLTYAEALKTISAASGRELAFRPISHEQAAENLRTAGVGERAIIWQRGLYDLMLEGTNAPVTDVVERVTGGAARSLDAYAAENADVWR